jgi:hypothetical protein
MPCKPLWLRTTSATDAPSAAGASVPHDEPPAWTVLASSSETLITLTSFRLARLRISDALLALPGPLVAEELGAEALALAGAEVAGSDEPGDEPGACTSDDVEGSESGSVRFEDSEGARFAVEVPPGAQLPECSGLRTSTARAEPAIPGSVKVGRIEAARASRLAALVGE